MELSKGGQLYYQDLTETGSTASKRVLKEPAIPLAAFASRKQYNDKIVSASFPKQQLFS